MPPTLPLLYHPTLNIHLHGAESPSTTQYRNLKYAIIPSRWKPSLANSFLTPSGRPNTFDAIPFGPSCPHKPTAQAWDLTLVGNISLPTSPGQGLTEKMHELDCLHLTVTVPKPSHGSPAYTNLPVFVWVHGGGLSMGSTSWPQYDLRAFVARSAELGKPVVGVAVNYRLGPFGFLASEELGVPGNLGFKDQVLGFRWVREHIGGFGGDAGNVTAVGESAGGISLSALLCAEVGGRLFDRVVVMSGEVTLRKPRGARWHEEMVKEQVRYLGLEGLSLRERRRALWEMDAEEMVRKLPLAQHFCGLVDGEWLREDVTLGVLADGRRREHRPGWCKEFVIGDTAHDGTVLKARILDDPRALERLKAACAKHLTPSETDTLLSAYGLVSPSSPEHQYQSILALTSEMRFYLPALAAHSGWKSSAVAKPAHRYHFHISNPVEGPFKDLSSHEFDVACLLQNFRGLFDEKTNRAALAMTDHFIGFLNGEGWANYGEVVVFGDAGVEKLSEEEYEQRFRDGRGEVLKSIGVDRVWNLAETWQGVRSEKKYNVARAKL
ncbi:alpha/beta-hydrolase [Corynespora cassiicola Philippines]|uniref:Alpha/beta-hydrolase n=1 Tax=Corynespora cassiicola Philippines TaxID=1448308 RepID=A0A2T2NDX2_CORCC|nr:alpha/beta-hydrolase [Corynespora cassiicola Philippines]